MWTEKCLYVIRGTSILDAYWSMDKIFSPGKCQELIWVVKAN